MKAQILKPTAENYQFCAKVLHDGGLVAFPTETVYGLGANALNRDAVCDIFKAKNRPFNDPVIVHVLSKEEAEKYIDVCDEERRVFHHLADTFWPGPLTIVMKARDILPKELSAGTGKVGFRCPKHEIVRELLRVSGLPIAAPSANKFGHISPTRAEHVYSDLHDWPVQILDGGEVVCNVGIESTVVGIDCEKHQMILFRRGGITENSLRDCLRTGGFAMGITEPVKHVPMAMKEAQVAPGQLITHYAPYCDTYLVQLKEGTPMPSLVQDRIKSTVVIDFNHLLDAYKPFCLRCLELSQTGDVQEAMRNIYSVLRQAEKVEGAKLILLPDLTGMDDEFAPSVMDRIVRATSGRLIEIPAHPVF
ncbi:translation factor (SUA5) [Blastocystis sp. ATCC 50177/Nand II]|uniref:Threonylcarbamoyl-AMP synthase n=1 Tax=Blastocystis sp. subtype 1 (strain ATCC 50177 / NandII) TaxID=478820 RepID=A0A196SBZ0_BLAHN|nr:translation factor (SUA5) [Blastocystis sp. ATCC 50177/Nand II]